MEVSKRTLVRAIGDEEFNVLALLKALAFVGFDLSSRYCGRGVLEGSAGAEDLTFRSSWALICFFICIFSWCLFFWYNFARKPVNFCASSEALCPSLAAFLRVLSSWSSLRACQLGIFVF